MHSQEISAEFYALRRNSALSSTSKQNSSSRIPVAEFLELQW